MEAERIKLLEMQVGKLDELTARENREAYRSWHKHTELLLKRIFGQNSDEHTEFSQLDGEAAYVVAGNPAANKRENTEAYFRHAKDAKSLLTGILDFLKSTSSGNETVGGPVSPGTLDALHSAVKLKCSKLYQDENYAEAVEKSFKIVKDRLRDLTTYEAGSDAFGKGGLYIKGATAPNVDGDFQQAVKLLTMAIDQFRNEKSHTSDSRIEDPIRAYEYLALSSLAMHLLEDVEINKSQKPVKQPPLKVSKPSSQAVSNSDTTVKLDPIQVLAMQVFGSMEGPKELIVSHVSGGSIIHALGNKYDEELLKDLNAADVYEVEANLDQLASWGVLNVRFNRNRSPIYSLTKHGYDLLKEYPVLVKSQ